MWGLYGLDIHISQTGESNDVYLNNELHSFLLRWAKNTSEWWTEAFRNMSEYMDFDGVSPVDSLRL